jgi:hypothetical protein
MILIPLMKFGVVVGHAVIDDVDFTLVEPYVWHPDVSGYARTQSSLTNRKVVYMHRLISGLPQGDRREVDHVNNNKTDNRRSNLRVVTRWGNNQNRGGANKGSTSQYLGVSWHTVGKKWIAQGGLNGQNHYLGLFDTEEEAHRAVTEWRTNNMPYSKEAATP